MLGYCCINMTLREQGIKVNRGCIKKTFQEKGLEYVSQLALLNVRDLIEIVKWNINNDIKVYRMSSSMFPWMSEYELQDLPDIKKITILLQGLGRLVNQHNLRLSFHPGHFNVLGSPNQSAIDKTVKEINQHAEIMDLIGLEQSHFFPINIHCNGTYNDKEATLARWCENKKLLSSSAQKRLVIENDDRLAMYSVQDLYDHVYLKSNTPITFDYHHHSIHSDNLTEQEAFELAMSTWGSTKPLFHYSSAKKLFEDESSNIRAHADMIWSYIDTYGYDIDIDLEAKGKELALLKYNGRYSNYALLRT